MCEVPRSHVVLRLHQQVAALAVEEDQNRTVTAVTPVGARAGVQFRSWWEDAMLPLAVYYLPPFSVALLQDAWRIRSCGRFFRWYQHSRPFQPKRTADPCSRRKKMQNAWMSVTQQDLGEIHAMNGVEAVSMRMAEWLDGN